jgi:hypothetical protein
MGEFISLGGNCAVTYQLRKLHLYNNSYPFDWCKLKIKNLIKVLKNDFKDFENIQFKKKNRLIINL